MKNRRNKEHLIAKREALKAELNWGPRLLEGAFGGAYRRYRVDGIPSMDPDTFLNRIRRFLIDLLKKESRTGAIRSQTTTWIRFRKDGEKKAKINPGHEDQECFKWTVIAASRWGDIDSHPERISKLKRFEADFDWSGIGFPVSIKDIKKFEFRNQISINLLAIEGKQIYICRKGGNYEHIINLMLITENDRKHCVAIKSLSRLLSIQNTKHKGKYTFA